MAPAPFSFPTLLEPYERPSDIARRPVTNSAGEDLPDDLSRKAYCILGMPIDAIEMPAVVREIRSAAEHGVRFLLSTPNLNFLVNCQQDPEFRESVLLSDLCPADGMPIVWIARLMGLPIKERIAGSDIFVALQAKQPSDRALQIFLFGGAEGVAEAAARSLNAEPLGMVCVGALDPGIGTVEEISQNEYIDAINLSGADFLAVSLGAKKGQLWLLRNHQRLRVPVRVHLGATINFQAGTVRRAPPRLRRWGVEWLWRIKEEPQLWRRYWNDGCTLLALILTHVLPLAISIQWQRLRRQGKSDDLKIELVHSPEATKLRISGAATARHIGNAISCFRSAVTASKPVTIDFTDVSGIDARFLGLLLMLRKQLKGRGASLKIIGCSPRMKRAFRLNGADFLIS